MNIRKRYHLLGSEEGDEPRFGIPSFASEL